MVLVKRFSRLFFVEVLQNAGNGGLVFFEGLLETWRLKV